MKEKKYTKKQKIIRTTIVILVIAVIIGLIYMTLRLTGAWEFINSKEKLQGLISKTGAWGIVVFMLIQFLQVTIIPIPAAATTIAGVILFGAWQTFLMSFVAVMVGSVFSFWLGRKFGRKLCHFMVGKESTDKWAKRLGDGKYVFFLMMLFPVFPDDILCIVAGLTTMSWRFFLITNLVTRPISIFCLCFFASGEIIPFSGYWLILWGFLALIMVALFILSYKFNDKIENFVQSIGSKLSKGKKKIGDTRDVIVLSEDEKCEKNEDAKIDNVEENSIFTDKIAEKQGSDDKMEEKSNRDGEND